MIAGTPTIDGLRVAATITTDDGEAHDVHWAVAGPPGPDAGDAADALLAVSLLPAMVRGEPLRSEHPVSARLLANVATIEDIFVSWSRLATTTRGLPPGFHYVQIDAEPRSTTARKAAGVAAFFSAGVDAFYTVAKHAEELTGLVFVHGFDVPLEDTARRELVIDGARRAAEELGLPLLEVETNAKDFTNRHMAWIDGHGAVLASVALLLANQFGRIYVPATQTYGTLTPLGSHPLLEPLWSTERVELVHDGCEATRLDKLRAIEDLPAARSYLRVCLRNDIPGYNCGRCEKCVRTTAGLRLLGTDHRFPTFPDFKQHRFVRLVARTKVPVKRDTWGLYEHTARQRGDRALARAIRLAYAFRRVRVRAWRIAEPARSRLRERRARRVAAGEGVSPRR